METQESSHFNSATAQFFRVDGFARASFVFSKKVKLSFAWIQKAGVIIFSGCGRKSPCFFW